MILAQALQRRLLKLAVMAKINFFQLKKSEISIDPLYRHLLTHCRLSREEREAAYNRARERIFGKDEKAGDATPGM